MKIRMLPTAEFTGVVLQITSQFLLYFVLLHSHSANKYLLKAQYDSRVKLNILMTRRK